MPTDTPETDRLLQAQYVEQGSLGPHNCPEWLTVHARKMERERDEARRQWSMHQDKGGEMYLALGDLIAAARNSLDRPHPTIERIAKRFLPENARSETRQRRSDNTEKP